MGEEKGGKGEDVRLLIPAPFVFPSLALLLGQEIRVLLERRLDKLGIFPKVGRKESVGVSDGSKGGLHKVAQGAGGATRGSIAIRDSSELQEFLWRRCSDDASAARGGDESSDRRAALASDFGGDGVRFTEGRTPVAATNGDDGKLCENDCASNCRSYFLGALDAQPDMAVEIPDHDERLEPSPLPRSSLLLHWHDLHNLVLELGQEVVHYLILLDGEGEEINLFNRLDLLFLD